MYCLQKLIGIETTALGLPLRENYTSLGLVWKASFMTNSSVKYRFVRLYGLNKKLLFGWLVLSGERCDLFVVAP
jgi:hypothetical protein